MKLELLQKYKNFILVGYGAEGKSSEKFLQTQIPNGKVKILDPVSEPIKFENESVYIISPGINRQTLCANIPSQHSTSNTEIFFENVSAENYKKTIGITGTKGKSTTTKFLVECLQQAGKKTIIGGNYGHPLLDSFQTINHADFLVAELSSYQLEFLSISPAKSIFLNIFSDHLDRHQTLKKYTQIKTNIWNGKNKPSKYCIIPESSKKVFLQKKLWSCFENQNNTTKFLFSTRLEKEIFPAESVFRATHFCENFGTVKTMLEILFSKEETEKILTKTAQYFVGLAHRIEYFCTKNGIKFYDDSISTNPDTSVAAVNFFTNRLGAIILGGYSGGGTYDELFQTLQKKAPQAFVWLPESNTKQEIINTAQAQNFDTKKIVTGKNFDALLKNGMNFIKSNSAVVLSPGAKSFDSFTNYKERGKAWKKSVENF